jgi:hypothetical protein
MAKTKEQKQIDAMAKLQNKLVMDINEAKLPLQDLYMVLTLLLEQAKGAFIGSIKVEKSHGGNVEKDSIRG